MSADPNELNDALVRLDPIEKQMLIETQAADLDIEKQTDAEQIKAEDIEAVDLAFSRPPQEDADNAGLMSAWGAGMVLADLSKDRELRRLDRDKNPRLNDDENDDEDCSNEGCC